MPFDIEFGVPVPERRAGAASTLGACLQALKEAPAGSSVVVELTADPNGQRKVGGYCNRHLGKGNFATRKLDDGRIRVWKLG